MNASKNDLIKNRNLFFTSDEHYGSKRTLELSKRPFSNTNEMDQFMITEFNKIVDYQATTIHLGDFGDYHNVSELNGRHFLIWGNYELNEFLNENQWIKDSIVKFKLNCNISTNEDIARIVNKLSNELSTRYVSSDSVEPIVKFLERYEESAREFNLKIIKCGFDTVLSYGVAKIEQDNMKLFCTHEPNDCNKEFIISPQNIQLFGHIHGRQTIKKYGIDVGVDAHHFRPLSLSDIQFFANAIENHYDSNVFE